MKRLICGIFAVFMIFALAGCKSGVAGNSRSADGSSGDEYAYSFKGSILEVYDGSVLILIDEGEDIRSSGDKVSVGCDGEFKNGDRVIVYYGGYVLETYPLTLNGAKVEKISE